MFHIRTLKFSEIIGIAGITIPVLFIGYSDEITGNIKLISIFFIILVWLVLVYHIVFLIREYNKLNIESTDMKTQLSKNTEAIKEAYTSIELLNNELSTLKLESSRSLKSDMVYINGELVNIHMIEMLHYYILNDPERKLGWTNFTRDIANIYKEAEER